MNSSFFQFTYFFSLIPSLVICGAWWFAATRRRNVSIFFWLAGTHSFALVVSVLQMVNTFGEQNMARLQSLSAVNMLVHLALAGLYVALVRWLVNQPDERN
jgi:hypothetical protein